MTLEELQKDWDSMKIGPNKSQDELIRMMNASPAWRLRRITEKEFITLSFIGLAVFILVVDGVTNWKVEVSLAWGTLQFLSQYFGLHYLRILPQKETIQQTLTDALARIKRLALMSYTVGVMSWIALTLIVGLNAHVGMINIIIWMLMLLPLVGAVAWWNARKWSKRMEEVQTLLKEFDDQTVPSY